MAPAAPTNFDPAAAQAEKHIGSYSATGEESVFDGDAVGAELYVSRDKVTIYQPRGAVAMTR
jgi:hypothetical protein